MEHPMKAKFGISLSNRAVLFNWVSVDDLIDAAKMAEDSGYFHGVWVGDNLLSKPRLDSIVTLSAIAAHTQRVKLGTICLASFPMRHPIVLAIQWATLDVISHGRTILAVCNGGSSRDGPQFARELDAMGVKSEERVGRLVEGVAILRRLWSEERVTHHGKYYQFADVELLPKPVQKPLPIYIAANPREQDLKDPGVDRILRRIATYGDGWQTDATTPEMLRLRFDRIRDYAARQGRDPSRLESCYHMMVNINEDKETALREAESFLALYYGAGRITRERMELWVNHGSPEAVSRRIQAYIDAGCTMPVLRFTSPNLKHQVRRCIEEVLPAFRASPAKQPASRR